MGPAPHADYIYPRDWCLGPPGGFDLTFRLVANVEVDRDTCCAGVSGRHDNKCIPLLKGLEGERVLKVTQWVND